MTAPVLIAGAGPTGLALALFLTRQGVAVRVIDKADRPGTASRAMALHARTLEFYRMAGFGDEVVARGIVASSLAVRRKGHEVARARLGDIGEPPSPYPFVLTFPQDDHERLLVEKLAALGVTVERGVELIAFEDLGDRITATLRGPNGDERAEAAYLCGCDGAHSVVRHGLPVEFAGAPYRQMFFVADAQPARGAPDNAVVISVDGDGFVLLMPVRSTGAVRVIGIVPRRHEGEAAIDWSDVEEPVRRASGFEAASISWFSSYRVHHRAASRFRVGRAFLLGDAAHIHSPAGGQGLNTGIGDAMNLSWKLAMALRGEAGDGVLDTYDTERRGFARTLLRTTDTAFELIAGRSAISTFWRLCLMPTVLSVVTKLRSVRRAAFRAVSQIQIAYPDSALSRGRAGKVRAGDRMPFVMNGAGGDNAAALDGVHWRVQVFGQAHSALATACQERGLAFDVYPWTEAAGRSGLVRDALYLLRPDGHVGFCAETQDPSALAAYLDSLRA